MRRALAAAVLLASSLLVAALTGSTPAQAADNGVAGGPAQGWSNWSVMQRDPTEAKVKAQAKALKDSGLLSHGYVYANIDDFWYLNPGTDVDANGRWVADPARFPKGMADMAAYVHGLGEKFGLYLTPGIPKAAYDRNTPIEGTSFHARDIVSDTSRAEQNYRHLGTIMYFIDYAKNPAAAQAYLNSWADQLAAWGVDYLKMDGVGSSDKADVTHWATALNQTGRKIYFGLSNNLGTTDIATWQASANAWRISGDVDCCQPEHQTTWALVSSRFTQAPKWAPYAGHGGWNDFDSLQIGGGDKVGITAEERKSGMTLWAISAAPLLIGADLTTLDAGDLALMTNDDVIAVDRAGIPATPVSQATGQQVWQARNPDGSYTVALFNLGGSAATVRSDFAAYLGFTGTAAIRDLWQRRDVGTANGSLSRTVPSHGSFVFRVVPDAGATFVGGPLVSARSGRCADAPGGRTVNTTRVQVWDCNGGANQKVGYSASAKTLKVLGKCFDAHGRATVNGTAVELNDCNGGTNQQWNLGPGGAITGVQSGLCLDVTGAANPNGTGLELWACNGGTNQQWTL